MNLDQRFEDYKLNAYVPEEDEKQRAVKKALESLHH